MNKWEYVYNVFQSVAPGYDAANARISLGQHIRWKKAAAVRVLGSVPKNGSVLDLCCGTGDLTELMLALRPDVYVTGLDFSPNMLAVAERRFFGESHVTLVSGDAMALPFEDGVFDGAVISFALRNTEDYAAVISEMARVVRPGAGVCCVDSFRPENIIVRPFYDMYFSRLMPLLGGGRNKKEEYRWLCRSTREFISPTELESLMLDAGLLAPERDSFLLGSCVSVCAYKRMEERHEYI